MKIPYFILLFLLPNLVFGLDKYPQIPIMHGFVTNFKENKQDEVLFPKDASNKELVNGMKLFREYECKTVSHPTAVQILKFHYDVISKLGGFMTFRTEEFASFKVQIGDKRLYVVLETYHNGLQYTLTVIETESGTSEEVLEAEEIFSKISKEGHLAFYFNFESGKSDLSKSATLKIREIAKMMKIHTDIKIMVEGHTDNVGSANDNLNLSKQRAAEVRNLLIKSGVSQDRLIARGVGQAQPVSLNTTEAGRVKNRRVELVKMR
jgi:outer membrane protein OmpA-like peptidoglycan-associated protein